MALCPERCFDREELAQIGKVYLQLVTLRKVFSLTKHFNRKQTFKLTEQQKLYLDA